MNKTLIFTFLAIFISDIALAIEAEESKLPDIDALIIQIKLDKSKATKFKAILEKHKNEIQAFREENRRKKQDKNHQMTREEFRTQRESRMDARDEELLTVLTYEQLYKYRKYMRQFRMTRVPKLKRPQPENKVQSKP